MINTGANDADIKMADPSVEGCRGDHGLGWALATDYELEISDLIRDFENIIVTAGLGGGTGAGAIRVIAGCAKDQGKRIVSVVTIPMSFEEKRRGDAMIQMKELITISDRTILLDMDRIADIGAASMKIDMAISVADKIIRSAITKSAEMLNGPFFSLLSEKVYTISYASSRDPVLSAEDAMKSPLFASDAAYGKIIVKTDSFLSGSDRSTISDAISNKTGIVPEVMSGNQPEGDGVMLFIPISYRALLS